MPTSRRAVLWPDNVAAWSAFMAVQTQWRHTTAGAGGGMAGMVLQPIATGLDYAGVCAYLGAQGYRAQARRGAPTLGRMLDDLRACEAAALDEWRRQAARRR